MEKFKPFGDQSIPPDLLLTVFEISSELVWARDMQSGKGGWLSSSVNTEKYNLLHEDSSVEAWINIIHEEDREKTVSGFSQALENKSVTTYEHEYRVRGKDECYFIRDKVKIQRDAAGKALQCIGVWNDLTETYEKTSQLQKSLDAQQKLNQELMGYQQKLKANEQKLEELNAKLIKNRDLLSEREIMLKTSQQIAKTGSWKFNLKNGKCSCSEEFFVIYGLDPDFNLTDPEFFLKVFYGTQKGSEILLCFDKLRTQGIPFDIVSHITTPLGIQKFVRLIAYPLYVGDTIAEIQGVAHDITAFKEGEERLRASEEKFFTLFKFTPDFMSLARESDGVIVEVNDKAQAVSGYSEKEMVGKTARELNLWVNPDDLNNFFVAYTKNFKATCEAEWRKKDGQLIHIMLSSLRVHIGDEDFRLSLVKDITALKKVEEQLRASEEKFSKLFRFNPDLMCLARESDYVIVDVNDKAEAISGYTPVEIIGKTARELNVWVNADHFDDLYTVYRQFGEVGQETKWRKKNGKKIDVLVNTVRIEIGGENYGLTIVKDITTRKEAEEKFSKAFSLSPDLMSIIREKDQVIVDVNENTWTMLGYSRGEVLGKTTKDLNLWAVPEERDTYYQIYRSNPKMSYEARWRKKNGEEIYVVINATRVELYDEPFILSSVRDVTARRQAEEKFYKAFNLSPDVMIIVREADQKIVDANEKISWLTGLSHNEVIGEKIDKISLGFEHDIDYNLKRYSETGDIRLESMITKKDGQSYYASISVNRIELTSENHMLIILRDISDQKAAENLLRRSEANLNATVNNTQMMIWSIDLNYILLTCNEATRQYVNSYYKENIDVGDSLKAKILDKILDPDAATFWKRLYERAFHGESVFQTYSAFDRHAEVSINPIWENGKITGVTAFTTEVTERIAHHNEVIKNLEQLAEVEKKLGEARVTALRSAMNPHFIFNALNSIQFFISKNERKQAMQYLSTFSKLIRGILNGSAQNVIRLVDEIELLKHYINLELIRFEKKFNVTINIDPEIDAGNIEIPALVVQPFVENAILHGLYDKTSEGNLKISIHKPNDEFVLFEVEDDGIGRVAAGKIQAKKNLEHHKSLGVALAEERLKILNSDPHFAVETEDLSEDEKPTGTRIKIWLRIQ